MSDEPACVRCGGCGVIDVTHYYVGAGLPAGDKVYTACLCAAGDRAREQLNEDHRKHTDKLTA